MAVPKKKKSKSRRNMRRSHDALVGINVLENKTTGEYTLAHNVSLDGYYKGRFVLERYTDEKKTAVSGDTL
jgi:large subunit ribosomal protein L32